MRDLDIGNFKGYVFINFVSFEVVDVVLEVMNG